VSPSSDRLTARPGPNLSGDLGAQDLPAPYESPWRLLRRDLIAVAASLRLRIRELWRRNREGDLSVPGIWPAALAPLFWPLLLALALALAVALPLVGVQALQRVSPPAGSAPPAIDDSRPAPQAELEPPPEPLPPPEPELRLDPLLELLADHDPEQLIRSARPDPAESRLVLELNAGFASLPAARRQLVAEQWLERSQALGYEQLQLVDGQGQLLGRRARVGSGMILLSPDAES
jgi:hypothetical protein